MNRDGHFKTDSEKVSIIDFLYEHNNLWLFSLPLSLPPALLYASIFGNVTTIFQEFTSNTARYHEVLNSVREFMKLHQVDKQLAERVVDYVISSWAVTKGIDKDRVWMAAIRLRMSYYVICIIARFKWSKRGNALKIATLLFIVYSCLI